MKHSWWQHQNSGDYFSAAGPGRLMKIEGNINEGYYCRILDDNQAGRELQLCRRFHFLYVNIPKHTAKATQIRKRGECSGVAMSMPNHELGAGFEKSLCQLLGSLEVDKISVHEPF